MNHFAAVLGFVVVMSPSQAGPPSALWSADVSEKGALYTTVRWAGFSPDGRRLVVRTLDQPPRPDVTPGTFHPSDMRAATSRLFAWHTEAWREAYLLEIGTVGEFTLGPPAAFLPNGNLLLVEKELVVERGADGRPTGQEAPGPSTLWLRGLWALNSGTAYFALTPDKDGRASGETELHRRLLPFSPMSGGQLTNPKKPARFPYPAVLDRGVNVAAISQDGTRLAQAYYRNLRSSWLTLSRLGAVNRVEVKHLTRGDATKVEAGAVSALVFTPDGRVLASGGADGSVRLYDVPRADEGLVHRATVRSAPEAEEARGTVFSLAFSPDGKVLAIGIGYAEPANVLLADADSGRLLRTFRAGGQKQVGRSGHAVMTLAFSPDGKQLVTGTSTGSVQVWETSSLLSGK